MANEEAKQANNYTQQINDMITDNKLTGFQAMILDRAINDESKLVKSMAIAFLAEPNKSSVFLQRLIDRYTVKLGSRYAQVEYNLNQIVTSGSDLDSSDRKFFIELIQKIKAKGERVVIMKKTLDKINELSESLNLPRI